MLVPYRDFATEILDILGLKSRVFLWHPAIGLVDNSSRNTEFLAWRPL